MPYKDPARAKAHRRMYSLTHRLSHEGLAEPHQYRKDFLVREVAALCELSLPKALKVVNAILSSMKGALKRGDTVSVPGFGKFLHHSHKRCGPSPFFVPSKQLVYLVRHPDYRR